MTKDNVMSGVPDVVICVDGDSVEQFNPILQHLCVGLIDQAIQVRLLSSDPDIELQTLGPVKAIRLPPLRRFISKRRINHMMQELSARSPTVFHALGHESYAWALGLADELDVEVVFTVASYEDCDAIGRLRTARPYHVIASSDPLADVLKNRYGISTRLSMVRPGILAKNRVSCFSNDAYTATLLCTADMTRGSGVMTFIEAVALLRERKLDVLAFLVGQGRHETELRRLARRLNVSSSITFAPQESPTIDIMNSSDIFVVPFHERQIWFRVLQAMGSGLACVVAENETCDYIQNGVTAFSCPNVTAVAFADAIEQLLQDRASAHKIAQTGQEYVRAHHKVSVMSERIAQIYRRISESHKTYTVHK